MAKKHQELIAKEGWIFLFPSVLLTLVSFALKWPIYVSSIFLLLAIWIAWFFRNPYRQIPEAPDAIVSPADGKVVGVHQLDDGRHLITIFLNVFNVHVNRCPIGGKITRIQYIKGKFLAAFDKDASKLNERNVVEITDGDFKIEVIQIAGLIARRIICWSKADDQVARGERFGLIRFGSRMDLILPESCDVLVKLGDIVSGGSDILAKRTDLSQEPGN